MAERREPYSSLSGIADGSAVRRDLADKLNDIGASASVAIMCLDEGRLDELPLALRDLSLAAIDLPRLEARVLNWERVFGSLRKQVRDGR